jgi:hypothetical protein
MSTLNSGLKVYSCSKKECAYCREMNRVQIEWHFPKGFDRYYKRKIVAPQYWKSNKNITS